MKHRNAIAFLAAFLFSIGLPISSFSQRVISYQGMVTEGGTPVQGTHNLTIAIYHLGNGRNADFSGIAIRFVQQRAF